MSEEWDCFNKVLMSGGVRLRWTGINHDMPDEVYITEPANYEPYDVISGNDEITVVSESGAVSSILVRDLAFLTGSYADLSPWSLAS